MNEFILGKQDFAWARHKLTADLRGQYRNEPAVIAGTKAFCSLLEFYAGLRALLENDMERFYSQMLAYASIYGLKGAEFEGLIAECELRQGPLKWKRRFAKWLRENAPSPPAKKSRPARGKD